MPPGVPPTTTRSADRSSAPAAVRSNPTATDKIVMRKRASVIVRRQRCSFLRRFRRVLPVREPLEIEARQREKFAGETRFCAAAVEAQDRAALRHREIAIHARAGLDGLRDR